MKFSTAWYLTEMPPLKRAFEDAMLEIPLDAELHSDLRLFTTVDGVVKLPKLKSGERKDRHGDYGIALTLAYAASRKRAISYGYAGGRDLDRETKRLMRDEPGRGRGLW